MFVTGRAMLSHKGTNLSSVRVLTWPMARKAMSLGSGQ